VLGEDGVRFEAGCAADSSQRISAAELAALIEVFDYEEIQATDQPAAALVGHQEWDWDRYLAEMGLPEVRVDLARNVVNLLSQTIAEIGLPWRPVFRKGYLPGVRHPDRQQAARLRP
jgi:hypothetical protein